VAFESPIYKAPSIPKISSRNISSSVIRGAEAVSSAATPRLRRSSFRFLQRPKLQGTQGSLKLETNQLDALQETNRILVEIQNQLAIDFATRIAERKQAIRGIKKQTEKERVSKKEASIESINKFNQGVGNFFDKVTAPAKNIFQKLIDFFGIIVSGIAINTAFTWLSDKNNQKKLSETLSFVGKYWKEIVGVLVGLQLISVVAKLIAAIQVVSAVLLNPVLLGALTTIIGFAARNREIERIKPYVRKDLKSAEETLNKKDSPFYEKLGAYFAKEQLTKPGGPQDPLTLPIPGAMYSSGGTIPNLPSYNFRASVIKQYPNIIQRFSSGGSVGGKGSGLVDSVRAMLAPGEEVIRSSAANLFRPLLKDINDNSGRLWASFSQGVREMLDGNKTLKIVIIDLQQQLTKFKDQLDQFINDVKFKKVDDATGGGFSTTNRTKQIQVSSLDQGSPKKPTDILRPVVKEIKAQSIRKPKRTPKAPIIIPMTAPPIVQGGGDELVQPSGGTATEEPTIGSVNTMNPYMRITSKIYGIFV
jgi:hypothetical protein